MRRSARSASQHINTLAVMAPQHLRERAAAVSARLSKHLRGGTLRDDAAAVEHNDRVAAPQELQAVCHEQHGAA